MRKEPEDKHERQCLERTKSWEGPTKQKGNKQ